MADFCNSCRRGLPEFVATGFYKGKVFHRYQCTECGQIDDRLVPFGWDMDHPRAIKSMAPTDDYFRRLGL